LFPCLFIDISDYLRAVMEQIHFVLVKFKTFFLQFFGTVLIRVSEYRLSLVLIVHFFILFFQVNPGLHGLVVVTSSEGRNLPYGKLEDILSRESAALNCHTNDDRRAWFAIDLGKDLFFKFSFGNAKIVKLQKKIS
jgi:hypothetical protein